MNGTDKKGIESLGLIPALLSTEAAARFLGIGRTLFCSMVSDGRMGPLPVRLGNRTLWRRRELSAWVDGGCPVRERWLELLTLGEVAPGAIGKIVDF